MLKTLPMIGALLALLALAGCGGTAAGTAQATASSAASAATQSTATAAPAATQGTATAAAAATQTAPAGATTYVIDGASSKASYSVSELLLNQNINRTAVGTTSAVSGNLVVSGGQIQPSTVTVNLTGLTSDQARRDQYVQKNTLDTATYPNAVFAITGATGPALADGQTVTLQLSGNMTIHGTTKPETFATQASMQGGTLHLVGTSSFTFEDFGMQPPTILHLLTVHDPLQINVDLTAKQG
ncbi:MAG TPA: YceI family protein [Bacillota bacterium]|nr:YceI family protein [Bacillota bacterium]